MRHEAIRFEPVSPAHYDMLHEWLKKPHVREWWLDPDEELALIRSIAEDDDGTRGYIVSVNGQPAGYIQSWRPAHFDGTHWADEAPWLGETPADTVGIDIFIGPETFLARGIGPAIIRSFAQKLFDEGAPRLLIDPDATNTRAVRAYEKAGFSEFSRHEGDDEITLLMELKREDFQRIS